MQLGMIHNPKNNPQGNFRTIPNGLPGVETRSPILWSEGVLKGKITRQRFVELNSTNAAKLCRFPFIVCELGLTEWTMYRRHVPQE
jgi:dihydroorotase-like cyclic amidohydrolase